MEITKQEFIRAMKEKPTAEAAAKLDVFFDSEWDVQDKGYENKKIDFNNKLTEGIVVVIPKKSHDETPIIIEPNTESGSNTLILILAEQDSTAQIMLNKTNKTSADIKNTVKIIAEENASINIIDVCIGGGATKSDIIARLIGQGAEINTTSLFLGKKNQQGNMFIAAIHAAPSTKSNIITRCIVNDKAKAINRGLIKIEENAFDSEGYQKQDALLLSETAAAEAIPNLEIYNNEVKCSHGSTVGQIDEEQLFYLMSRGIDENSAKQKIIEGYFVPAIEMFKNPEIKERIYALIISAIE